MSIAALTGSEQGLGSQQTWVQILVLLVSMLLTILFAILSRSPRTRAGVAVTAQWKKPDVAWKRTNTTRAPAWRTVDGYTQIDLL